MKKNKSETAVSQSNLLIESRYKLTLNEIKLFLWMIKQVHPRDKDFKTYRLDIKEFSDSTASNSTAIYTRAKEITKAFLSKVHELDGGNLQIGFLSSVRYHPGKGYISYRFDPDLKPYLLQLREQFTTYHIENILMCKHTASIRLYQLLKSFEGLGTRKMLLEDLRYKLVMESRYRQWHDFKRYILDRSRKEINKLTDIRFNYTFLKRGRTVFVLIFTVKTKDPVAPGVSYHGSMTPTLDRLEEEGKDACPMPAELKDRIK